MPTIPRRVVAVEAGAGDLDGGGFRGGMTYGATDEFGNSVVENPLDIHDGDT